MASQPPEPGPVLLPHRPLRPGPAGRDLRRPHGLGDILDHLLNILIEERIVLYDQKAVTALLQDGHELEEGVGPADLQGGEPAVQAA